MPQNKIRLLLISLSFISVCFAQKTDIKKEDTAPHKEAFPERKKPTFLTVYNDLALVEKSEILAFSHEKQVFSFHGFPSDMLDQSLFLSDKENTVQFLEFFTKNTDETKTLSFEAKSKQGEKHEINIAYATKNITWEPFYTAEFSKNCDFLTLEGWIDVSNKTHTDFESTNLVIIDNNSALSDDENEKLKNKTNTENQYAFDFPVEISKKSSKRLNWVKYTDVPAIKEYRLNVGGTFLEDQANKNEVPPLELWVTCTNKNKQLPEGPLVLYKKDINGQKQILTKMNIPFVKACEPLSFKMPHVMDEGCMSKQSMKIAYEQTEFQRFTGKIVETANRITIQNISESPLSVKVFVDFPAPDGMILRENIPHQVDQDKRSFWLIEVPVNEKIDLRYRLRFSQKKPTTE